jgi:hypothetical protein
MPRDAREGPARLVTRFLTNTGPWDKQSLSLASYWVKLLLSLIIGSLAGFLELSGMATHLCYGLACHLTIHLYVSSLLGVDVEALFGSAGALLMEGLFPSYAAFVLAWSVVTTVRYGLQK